MGLTRNFEADLLWLAGNAKTLEISRDFRLGDLKGCCLPKRKAIQTDGFSFWCMSPAANPWFNRPIIPGISPASALRAGGFVDQTKQLSRRHGGGFAAGVLPYCPIHPLIHRAHKLRFPADSVEKRSSSFLKGLRNQDFFFLTILRICGKTLKLQN